MAVVEVSTPEHLPIEATTDGGEDVTMCVCGVMCRKDDMTREFVQWFLEHLKSGRFVAYDLMDSELGRRRQVL